MHENSGESKDKPGPLIDLESKQSTRSGLSGRIETALRRFRTAAHMLILLPLYAIGSIAIGLAMAPAFFLLENAWHMASSMPALLRYPFLGISAASSFFLYGFCLLLVVPACNSILGRGMKAWRGPYHSLECVKWYVHNGLTYLARYTFLEFVTPTPFNIIFFRLMGMKIGCDVQINSSNISDPSLIEIGDKVTIGGSATLIAHYGMGGLLVISPVKIEDRVTIGLKATIMGGVHIEAGAKVLANSVVLPRTRIPAGETWGGVPARKIDLRKAA